MTGHPDPLPDVGYGHAHALIVRVRGKATELPCVWCGAVGRSNAWSFDYRAGDRTRVCPRRGHLYLPSPWDYSVRCGRCHKVWDGINERGSVPLLEAAAWLLDRMDAHGGEVHTSVINAEADAAGIPRGRLSEARRWHTDIETVRTHTRSRVWRLPQSSEIETADAV